MTAVQLVNGFNGFGVHTLLSIVRSFPNLYKNIIFVSVAVCDSGSFKGPEAVCDLTDSTREALEKYVDLARRLGLPAEYRFDMGTDVVESATQLCEKVAEEFPRSTFFTGQLVFQRVRFFQKLLHNETALCHPATSPVGWHDHCHPPHPRSDLTPRSPCLRMRSDD